MQAKRRSLLFGSNRLPHFAVVFLSLVLLLSACGGSAPSSSSSSGPVNDTSGGGAANTGARAAASSAPAAVSGAAPVAPGALPTTGAATQSGSGSTQASPGPLPKRLLIKTGTLGLVVSDVDVTFGRIRAIAQQYGGEVSQYTNSKSGERRLGTVTILVDSAQFEAAMTALREMSGIVERRADKAESTDVSEEFADVQAQITNLEATERQLRGIMEKATRTEDILNIQREITNVRGQIERLQGRANYLDRRAAMSTIAINLETPVVAGPATPTGTNWRFTVVVGEAWVASLKALQVVATVVITVAVFCWWLLPLLALGVLAWRLRRRRSGRGGAAGSPPTAPPAAPPATATGD